MSAPVIVTEQVLVPLQPAPLHPVKVDPVLGVAVSVTTVPVENGAEQVLLVEVQALMPAGLLETEPVPDTATVRTRRLVPACWRCLITRSRFALSGAAVGGVAQGLFTKSKNSFMEVAGLFLYDASRPVSGAMPKRVSTIASTAVVSRTVWETKFLTEYGDITITGTR